MEAPSPNKRPPQWRRRFYVHKIQRTYAIWLGLFMFFSALLVFGLVFFIPFILPAIKLASPLPLAERGIAGNQFMILAQTVWPAFALILPAAGVFSLYLSHRWSGILTRFDLSDRALVRGHISLIL